MHNSKPLTDLAKPVPRSRPTSRGSLPRPANYDRDRTNLTSLVTRAGSLHVPPRRGRIVNVTNRMPMQFDRSVSSSLLHLDHTRTGADVTRREPLAGHVLEMPTPLRISGQPVKCQIDCETCQLY
jgi:hypothetical protein